MSKARISRPKAPPRAAAAFGRPMPPAAGGTSSCGAGRNLKNTARIGSGSLSTELPYQVNKKHLVAESTIADQVKEKRLEGISDLRDESDRNGMRIVIRAEKGRQ